MTTTAPLASQQLASAARRAGGPAPAPEQELPLEWQLPSGVPAVPRPRHLRVVGPDERGTGPSLEFVARMAQAVTEVGYGTRPAGQLTRWVARPALAMLAARGACVQRHPASRARTADRTFRTVRAIRVCEVADGAYETSAVLVGAQRSRAVAMRMERSGDGRYVVTAVSLG